MEYAIVLTGTIIPNSTFVIHSNYQERRKEYLFAINYYRKFATVFFLENSSYDLENDLEFKNLDNVFIRKFPKSHFFEKGKGFQEFEMIDNWVKTEKNMPYKWIKITGRYIVKDIEKIINESLNHNKKIIIDSYFNRKIANTFLFFITTEFYKDNFIGIFKECDDNRGLWIEKILYFKLKEIPKELFSFFSTNYTVEGISGSTGEKFIQKDNFKIMAKTFLRKLNYKISENYIYINFI